MEAHQRESQHGNKEEFLENENNSSMEQFVSAVVGTPSLEFSRTICPGRCKDYLLPWEVVGLEDLQGFYHSCVSMTPNP